jgi:hypothetical protein
MPVIVFGVIRLFLDFRNLVFAPQRCAGDGSGERITIEVIPHRR